MVSYGKKLSCPKVQCGLLAPEPGISGVLHGYGGLSSRAAGFKYQKLHFGFLPV